MAILTGKQEIGWLSRTAYTRRKERGRKKHAPAITGNWYLFISIPPQTAPNSTANETSDHRT
jgi:hypothetical protein